MSDSAMSGTPPRAPTPDPDIEEDKQELQSASLTVDYSWERTAYVGATELTPGDIPRPLGGPVRMVSCVDSDLCHNMLNGKAVTAILHFLNQTPFDWYSKKQATVETATCGAEYSAARTCVGQIGAHRLALMCLGVPILGSSYMSGDNKSVVDSSTGLRSRLHKRQGVGPARSQRSPPLALHLSHLSPGCLRSDRHKEHDSRSFGTPSDCESLARGVSEDRTDRQLLQLRRPLSEGLPDMCLCLGLYGKGSHCELMAGHARLDLTRLDSTRLVHLNGSSKRDLPPLLPNSMPDHCLFVPSKLRATYSPTEHGKGTCSAAKPRKSGVAVTRKQR